MHVSSQGSPLFELLKQEHEGGAAEQVEAPASFSQPLQHNHTAADLWVRRPTFVCLPFRGFYTAAGRSCQAVKSSSLAVTVSQKCWRRADTVILNNNSDTKHIDKLFISLTCSCLAFGFFIFFSLCCYSTIPWNVLLVIQYLSKAEKCHIYNKFPETHTSNLNTSFRISVK